MINFLDISGSLLILIGLYMVGSRNPYGFILAAIGAALHCLMGALLGVYGLMILCACIVLLDVRSYRTYK